MKCYSGAIKKLKNSLLVTAPALSLSLAYSTQLTRDLTKKKSSRSRRRLAGGGGDRQLFFRRTPSSSSVQLTGSPVLRQALLPCALPVPQARFAAAASSTRSGGGIFLKLDSQRRRRLPQARLQLRCFLCTPCPPRPQLLGHKQVRAPAYLASMLPGLPAGRNS